MDEATAYENVVQGLSFLIKREYKCAASEQAAPSHGGDSSDEVIRDALQKAGVYNSLRDSFERAFTGVLTPRIRVAPPPAAPAPTS